MVSLTLRLSEWPCITMSENSSWLNFLNFCSYTSLCSSHSTGSIIAWATKLSLRNLELQKGIFHVHLLQKGSSYDPRNSSDTVKSLLTHLKTSVSCSLLDLSVVSSTITHHSKEWRSVDALKDLSQHMTSHQFILIFRSSVLVGTLIKPFEYARLAFCSVK